MWTGQKECIVSVQNSSGVRLHSLARDVILWTVLSPTDTKNWLNLSFLLNIPWDVDLLGMQWQIAFQILLVLFGFLWIS